MAQERKLSDGADAVRPTAIDDLLAEASAMIRRGDAPARVVTLLESALPDAKDDPAVWYHLGVARLQAGRARAGAEALRRSLDLHDGPNAWHYLGYACIEMGDIGRARESLTRCLELGGPEQARYELAYACHLAGEHEEAAQVVRRYIREVPDDPDGWELYQAVCRAGGRERSYRRFLSRHASPPLTELLDGRDAFSMGGLPFPVPMTGGETCARDLKLDFLANVGGAYLGTASDDGVYCTSFRRRSLTPSDIGVMLVRLSGVLSAAHIRPSAVIAVDAASVPATEAAAALLGVTALPRAPASSSLSEDGLPILLAAEGHDWLAHRRSLEAIGVPSLSVVLAFDWFQAGLPFDARFCPDVTGFIALEVPPLGDEASRGGSSRRRILDAARAVPVGEAEAQRHYYHTQPGLRFRGQ